MGLFCFHCAYIYGEGAPELIHQAGCPNEAYGHRPGFDPTEARLAMPKGGTWVTATRLRDTLRVTAPDGSDPRNVRASAEVWWSPGPDWPSRSTLAACYEAGGGRAWLGSPHEPGAEEIRVESPVERAERLGRLWASGATGEGLPR